MINHAGLPIKENKFEYKTIEELILYYQTDAAKVAEVVSDNWTDDQVGDKIKVYDLDWSIGDILHILITHQTHHRGQLTV